MFGINYSMSTRGRRDYKGEINGCIIGEDQATEDGDEMVQNPSNRFGWGKNRGWRNKMKLIQNYYK